MNPQNLLFLPAHQQARQIREGKLSARELLEAHISQIEQHNPAINALITHNFAAARHTADQLDQKQQSGQPLGLLHGLPFTAKDIFASAGMPTTFGNPEYRNFTPQHDATLLKRYREAGGILVGKTNLPLFALGWQSKNRRFGLTRNPYDLGRTVGGSSGGSAAALAAGFTALEIGSDLGGSIRIPAHFCGVSGLRPTEGALSDLGHVHPIEKQRPMRYQNCVGPMARTVEDLRLAMRVLWGQDDRRWEIPPLEQDWDAPPRPLSKLRIAYSPTFGEVPVSRATREAQEQLLGKLREAGCQVEEAHPPLITEPEALQIWGRVAGFEITAGLPWLLRKSPLRRPTARLVIQLWFGNANFARGLARGIGQDAHGFQKALHERDLLIRETDLFLQKYDFWITPVASVAAFPHCRTGAKLAVDEDKVSFIEALARFTCPTTAAAHPILSLRVNRPGAVLSSSPNSNSHSNSNSHPPQLKIHRGGRTFSSSSLPIGMQIHARRWQDKALLDFGEQIQALVGGFQPPEL